MADTNIFEIDNHDIDLKNYQKINLKASLNDTVILKFDIYDNSSPVDLTGFNVEFRAYLPKSSVPYSQVDNIVKSGNTLTITCDKELCQEIGQIQATLRIWNSQMLQKSNYLIVLKVMSTIPSDETLSTTATLSALNSLDWSINRYIELKTTLGDKITEAQTMITNISISISNANNIVSNLNTSINNANITKQSLDTSNTNALTTNSTLNSTITNAGITQSNLQAKINEGNTTINNLDTSTTNAQTTKTALQTLVNTANQELQDFKNFDTNQIVVKQNQMYDELFPINELVTIEHNLGVIPLVQFIVTDTGFGMSTYGTSYFGGFSECNLGTYKVRHLSNNKLTLIVSNNYYLTNPTITKINDYEYTISFIGYSKSMTIKLLVVDNNSYLIDPDGNYLIDELNNYLMG